MRKITKRCRNFEVVLTKVDSGKKLFIIGAGGHARAIASLVKRINLSVDHFLDDNKELHSTSFDGVPVKGFIDDFSKDFLSFIGIGDNKTRKTVADRCKEVKYQTLIHPSAIISEGVEIGQGTVIMAGAIIQPGSKIGNHVIVNSGVVVEHDCTLSDYSHIAANATMAGSCTLGEGAFVGINACVIEGKKIGAWSKVGAGACVIKDIPLNCVAVGVPAKPIKFYNE